MGRKTLYFPHNEKNIRGNMLTEKQIMFGGGVERFRVGEKEEVIPHILRIKNGNIDLEKKWLSRILVIYILPKAVEEKLLIEDLNRKYVKVMMKHDKSVAKISRNIQLKYAILMTGITALVSVFLILVLGNISALFLLIFIIILIIAVLISSKKELETMDRSAKDLLWLYRSAIANQLRRIAIMYGKKCKPNEIRKMKLPRYVLIEWSVYPYFSEHVLIRS